MKLFVSIAACCALLFVLITCGEGRVFQQPSPSDRLFPLKRQKKSIQNDLALILPAAGSSFRERQRSALERPTFLKDVKRHVASAFSERQHSRNLHRRPVHAGHSKKREDGQWSYATWEQIHDPGFEGRPRKRDAILTSHWDPMFPAYDMPAAAQWQARPDGHSFAGVDSVQKRLAWNSMSKRLHLLDGKHGAAADHSKRRRRINKRTPLATSTVAPAVVSKKELDSIFADDPSDKENRSSSPKSATEDGKKNDTATGDRSADTGGDSSKHHHPQSLSSKSQSFKGKEWVPPLDSDRTLRSKKSWDDYFGIDKRSIPEEDSGAAVDNDDIGGEGIGSQDGPSDSELKDFLVKWYFDKMLHHVIEHPTPSSSDDGVEKTEDDIPAADDDEDEWNDTDNDSDKKKKKKKKRDFEDSDEVPLKAVDMRLKKIEDMILLKATRLLEEEMNDEDAQDEGIVSIAEGTRHTERMLARENYILEHLKAAFSLEKMRKDLEEFESSLTKLKLLDEEFLNAEENAIFEEKKKRFQEIDDDKKKKKMRKDDSGIDSTGQVLPPAAIFHNDQVYVNEGVEPSPTCPVMSEAIDYCDDLGQALGDVGLALMRSCVEHMLCYTCEGLPSLCDSLFLRRAMELCHDDFRCQAMAAAMRSVFLSNHDEFRRRNGPFCVHDQCLAKLVMQDK